MSNHFPPGDFGNLRSRLERLALSQNVVRQIYGTTKSVSKRSSKSENLSVKPKLVEFLREEERRHLERVISVNDLVRVLRKKQQQCETESAHTTKTMLDRVYRRPLLCEIARDPELVKSIKDERRTVPPSPRCSVHEPDVRSVGYSESHLDMSHGDSLQGSARQFRSRTADREPPRSVSCGHPNYSEMGRNDHIDRRRKQSFPASFSGTRYTPSRERSIEHTATEFDSEESVLAAQDDRRLHVTRDRIASPRPRPRTGFCKVHGYTQSADRNQSRLSHHPLRSSVMKPGNYRGGKELFDDDDVEDPDERYSYSYDYSEEVQSDGRHHVYHRHVQNHHSHGDQFDQRRPTRTPKTRQQADPSLDYSYQLPNTSLRKAKSVQVVDKNRNLRDTRKYRSSEWESDYDRGP